MRFTSLALCAEMSSERADASRIGWGIEVPVSSEYMDGNRILGDLLNLVVHHLLDNEAEKAPGPDGVIKIHTADDSLDLGFDLVPTRMWVCSGIPGIWNCVRVHVQKHALQASGCKAA